MTDTPRKRREQTVVVAGTSGIMALIGYRLGGPLGVTAGAAWTPYAVQLVERVKAELTRKGNIISDAALEASHMNEDEFSEALLNRPELYPLMEKIARAAAESGYEPKLRALGALLGKATARQDRPLGEILLIDALTDIDEPGVLALEVLTQEPPDGDLAKRPGQTLKAGMTLEAERSPDQPLASAPSSWLPTHIDQQLDMTPGTGLAALNALTRHGLAEEKGTYGGGSRFVITDLGHALLKVINPGAVG